MEADPGAAGRGPGAGAGEGHRSTLQSWKGGFRAVYRHRNVMEPKGCCRCRHKPQLPSIHLTSPQILLESYYALGLGQRTHMGS